MVARCGRECSRPDGPSRCAARWRPTRERRTCSAASGARAVGAAAGGRARCGARARARRRRAAREAERSEPERERWRIDDDRTRGKAVGVTSCASRARTATRASCCSAGRGTSSACSNHERKDESFLVQDGVCSSWCWARARSSASRRARRAGWHVTRARSTASGPSPTARCRGLDAPSSRTSCAWRTTTAAGDGRGPRLAAGAIVVRPGSRRCPRSRSRTSQVNEVCQYPTPSPTSCASGRASSPSSARRRAARRSASPAGGLDLVLRIKRLLYDEEYTIAVRAAESRRRPTATAAPAGPAVSRVVARCRPPRPRRPRSRPPRARPARSARRSRTRSRATATRTAVDEIEPALPARSEADKKRRTLEAPSTGRASAPSRPRRARDARARDDDTPPFLEQAGHP